MAQKPASDDEVIWLEEAAEEGVAASDVGKPRTLEKYDKDLQSLREEIQNLHKSFSQFERIQGRVTHLEDEALSSDKTELAKKLFKFESQLADVKLLRTALQAVRDDIYGEGNDKVLARLDASTEKIDSIETQIKEIQSDGKLDLVWQDIHGDDAIIDTLNAEKAEVAAIKQQIIQMQTKQSDGETVNTAKQKQLDEKLGRLTKRVGMRLTQLKSLQVKTRRQIDGELKEVRKELTNIKKEQQKYNRWEKAFEDMAKKLSSEIHQAVTKQLSGQTQKFQHIAHDVAEGFHNTERAKLQAVDKRVKALESKQSRTWFSGR